MRQRRQLQTIRMIPSVFIGKYIAALQFSGQVSSERRLELARS
jgi:hypothetical protein